MYYLEVIKNLNEKGVKFLAVGGLAVNLHGVHRFTKDIDIILLMENDNIKHCIQVLTNLGYKPKVPVDPFDLANEDKRKEWIYKKNMKAFNLFIIEDNQVIKEVDIVIEHPLSFIKAYEKRVLVRTFGVDIPIVSIDDLIRMKETSGRINDIADVKNLKLLIEAKKKQWPKYGDESLKDWSVFNSQEFRLYEYSKMSPNEIIYWLNEMMIFNLAIHKGDKKYQNI